MVATALVDEGGSTLVGDLLEDPSAEDEIERVPQDLAARQVRRLLATLTDRERAVISGRFGIEGPEQTLRALGDRLGVSAERVRQIERRALERLQAGTLDD